MVQLHPLLDSLDILLPYDLNWLLGGRLLLVVATEYPLEEGGFADGLLLLDGFSFPLLELDGGGRVQESAVVGEPNSLLRACDSHTYCVSMVTCKLEIIDEDPILFYEPVL